MAPCSVSFACLPMPQRRLSGRSTDPSNRFARVIYPATPNCQGLLPKRCAACWRHSLTAWIPRCHSRANVSTKRRIRRWQPSSMLLGWPALRRARTDSVGLVVSNVAQPVFAGMVRGVESEATKAGYILLLANSGEDKQREADALAALTARRVDGLIIAAAAHSSWRDLDAIRRDGTPVVLMDRTSKLRTDMVGVENAAPMRDLVLHLIDHGHRRIALAAGDLAVSTIAERHQGYFDALAEAKIKINAAYVLTGSGLSEDSRADVRRLFDLRQPPT